MTCLPCSSTTMERVKLWPRRPASSYRYHTKRVIPSPPSGCLRRSIRIDEMTGSCTQPPGLLTGGCALTGRSAVNERNRERGGQKGAPDGRTHQARPENALSRHLARSGRCRKPLRILAIKQAAPGSLRPGVSRELGGRTFRDRSLTSPSRTRTCDLAVNSRSLYQLSYRGLFSFLIQHFAVYRRGRTRSAIERPNIAITLGVRRESHAAARASRADVAASASRAVSPR